MEYTIDFKKTYKPDGKSIECDPELTAVVCCQCLINEPVHFTFYKNCNGNGKILGRTNNVEIEVKIGEATLEELIDAYFNRKTIGDAKWKSKQLW